MKNVTRIVLLVASLLTAAATAQEPRADSKPDEAELAKDQINLWMKFYRTEAAGYQMNLGSDREKRLTLQTDPVLRWTNPVLSNGSTHGATFVWLYDGRPEVIGTIFSYTSSRSADQTKRVIAHSFHSLSLGPLLAERDGMIIWSPDEAGVEPTLIPGSPVPAASTSLRLVQMRKLARQFHATSGKGDNQRELRLMSQPLVRYQGGSSQAVDGGLFCYVTGTDPELILLIEARKTSSGMKWHFSAARYSHLTLRLWHRDKEVWKYLRGGPNTRPTGPKHRYLSLHGVSIRDRIIEK